MSYLGKYTKTDLRDASWFSDASTGVLNRQGARFGLELAQLAYDFDALPWLSAGWTDLTFQVDQRLFSGVRGQEDAWGWRQYLMNSFVPQVAKSLTRLSNPIKDARGIIDSSVNQETGKAVVMCRHMPDGLYLIALAFMGTGRRLQDWANNLRLASTQHFHDGFLQLANQFEGNAQNIHFPSIADALGQQTLTLAQVLATCTRADSPFRVVAAGHSQGAAVLQAWAYRRTQEGMHSNYLAGFGFASPMAADMEMDADYQIPINHFLSSDDVFTRVGQNRHLGRCYQIQADAALRQHCYGEYLGDPLFQALRDAIDGISDTGQGLAFCLAYLDALSAQPPTLIGPALASLIKQTTLDLPKLTDEWIGRVISQAMVVFSQTFADAYGREPSKADWQESLGVIEPLLARFGPVACTEMLFKALRLPHALVNNKPGMSDRAPYCYLVVRAFHQLEDMHQT